MNNQLELYDELKKLKVILDMKIEEKVRNMNHVKLSVSRVNSFKRWIFNLLDKQ